MAKGHKIEKPKNRAKSKNSVKKAKQRFSLYRIGKNLFIFKINKD